SDILCPVPVVVNLTQSAATAAITAAGFTVGTVSAINDCVNPGIVRSQGTQGGTRAAWRSSITISVGTCTAATPNVMGLTRSAATAAIAAAGLTVGTVTPLNSCALTPDTVQLQVPLGGTAVAKGSAVNMKVATCVVPNVIGLT